MLKNALVNSLSRWAERSLRIGDDHCLELRRHLRLPGAGAVDLLTLRHARDHFVVGLWNIQAGAIDERDIDAMTRRVHAFEAWYLELLEHAETQGFGPAHRISVCGNLVGCSVRSSPLANLLSNWGGSLFFWKWTRSPAGGFDVLPCYGKSPALSSARAQLKGLLHHLPWQDTGERLEHEVVRGKSAAP